MNNRPIKKNSEKINETYTRIVESATGLFRMYGYNVVSLNDIQTASATNRGTIYYYFPNGKEELAEHVIRGICDATTGKLKRYFTGDGEPLTEIMNYFESMVQEIDNRQCSISINLLLLEVAEINERLKAASMNAIETINECFLEEVSKCGLSEETTTQLAATIVSILIGAVNNCMLLGSSNMLKHSIPQIPLIFEKNGYSINKQ